MPKWILKNQDTVWTGNRLVATTVTSDDKPATWMIYWFDGMYYSERILSCCSDGPSIDLPLNWILA